MTVTTPRPTVPHRTRARARRAARGPARRGSAGGTARGPRPGARARRRAPAERPRAPGRSGRPRRWRRCSTAARTRPAARRAVPASSVGVLVDAGRDVGEQCPGRRQAGVDRAGVRQGVRVQRAPVVGPLQGPGHAAGAAPPHRGHPDGAVPEAWPAQVGLRSADGCRRGAVEAHRPAVAARHRRRRPGAVDRSGGGLGQVDGEHPVAVVRQRGDQGQVAGARAAAPRLGAGEPPTGPGRLGADRVDRRVGRPDAPYRARPVEVPRAELVEDREGVEVRLAQPGEVQVDGPEVGEQGEVRGCPALARAPRRQDTCPDRVVDPAGGPGHGIGDVRPEVGQDAAGRGCRGGVHQRRLPRSGAVTRRNPAAGSRVGIYVPASRRPARRKGPMTQQPLSRTAPLPESTTTQPDLYVLPELSDSEDTTSDQTTPAPATDVFDQEVATPDLVRLYLDEIGKAPLLDAATEVDLAQRIEAGLYARHLLDQLGHRRAVKLREARKVASSVELTRLVDRRRGRQARLHQGEPAAGRLAGPPLQPCVDAVARPHPGGQRRPGPRRGEVRLRARLQVLDVRHVVDPAVHRPGHRRAEPHRPPARAPGREAQPAQPHPTRPVRVARPGRDRRRGGGRDGPVDVDTVAGPRPDLPDAGQPGRPRRRRRRHDARRPRRRGRRQPRRTSSSRPTRGASWSAWSTGSPTASPR